MSPAPVCPVIFVTVVGGGRLVLIRRVEILTEECVITAGVPEVFQSPGSHGYVVSIDGMSSWTVKSTTVFWLISPRVTRMVSSFEKWDHPNSILT